jgi:hypothetical protein
VRTPAAAPTYLDRVLAAVARRALRRPSVRTLLALEIGPERHEGGEVYVPAAGGCWRCVATANGETAQLWRPSPFWERRREPSPSRWRRWRRHSTERSRLVSGSSRALAMRGRKTAFFLTSCQAGL